MIDTQHRPDHAKQRSLLRALKDAGKYGVLFIMQRPGDVPFAISPVPVIRGYEIVCASPEHLYDIWKDGSIVAADQTRSQINQWLTDNTPEWLYDDSTITDMQQWLVAKWVEDTLQLYPGIHHDSA